MPAVNRVLEICAFSVEDALAAAEHGAQRIEFCCHYELGGLSPAFSDTQQLLSQLPPSVDLAVMVRPRAGDFVYSRHEQYDMLEEVRQLGELGGVEAVVFGALKPQGGLDESFCQEMVNIAHSYGMKAVLHRAADELPAQETALLAARCGFDRWLRYSPEADAALRKELAGLVPGVQMVHGGGLRSSNARQYQDGDWHSSARVEGRFSRAEVKALRGLFMLLLCLMGPLLSLAQPMKIQLDQGVELRCMHDRMFIDDLSPCDAFSGFATSGWDPAKPINEAFCSHQPACNRTCAAVQYCSWEYRIPLFPSSTTRAMHPHWLLTLEAWMGGELELYIGQTRINATDAWPYSSRFDRRQYLIDDYLSDSGQDTLRIVIQSGSLLAQRSQNEENLHYPAETPEQLWLRQPAYWQGWDFCRPLPWVGLSRAPELTGFGEEGLALHSWAEEDSSPHGYEFGGERNAWMQRLLPYQNHEQWPYYAVVHAVDLLPPGAAWPNYARKDSALHWDFPQSTQRALWISNHSDVVNLDSTQWRLVHTQVPLSLWAPEVWNTADRGKPHRYSYELVDGALRHLGHLSARRLKIDTLGGKFAWYLNGQPFFAKGANVVLGPTRSSGPAEAQCLALLPHLVEQGYNALRIWGGGDYASPAFVEACDSLGILLWHDLAFANTVYPNNAAMERCLEREAEQLRRRLLGHPSTALVCGNNEIEVAFSNWGWQEQYGWSEQESQGLWQGYMRRFDTLLRAHFDGFFYLRSSPIGNWGNLSQMSRGDNHDWGVWHGEKRFNAGDSAFMPFVSEYGFPSFPWPVSAELARDPSAYFHSYKGLALLKKYRDWELGPSPDFWQLPGFDSVRRSESLGEFAKQTQLLQAQYLDMAMRQHRTALHGEWPLEELIVHGRNINASGTFLPSCSGSLLWQLNDIDEAVSWSLYDWQSKPKLAASAASQAMASYAVYTNGEEFRVAWGPEPLPGQEKPLWIRVQAYGAKGKVLSQWDQRIDVPGQSPERLSIYSLASFMNVPAEACAWSAQLLGPDQKSVLDQYVWRVPGTSFETGSIQRTRKGYRTTVPVCYGIWPGKSGEEPQFGWLLPGQSIPSKGADWIWGSLL